jgi:hypothetical protein
MTEEHKAIYLAIQDGRYLISTYVVFAQIICNVTLIDWDHTTAKMCVIFLSNKYGRIMWQAHEMQSVR